MTRKTRNQGRERVKVTRSPGDISPKVTVPVAILAVAAVVIALVTGLDPVSVGLLLGSVVTAVAGYATKDKVEV